MSKEKRLSSKDGLYTTVIRRVETDRNGFCHLSNTRSVSGDNFVTGDTNRWIMHTKRCRNEVVAFNVRQGKVFGPFYDSPFLGLIEPSAIFRQILSAR